MITLGPTNFGMPMSEGKEKDLTGHLGAPEELQKLPPCQDVLRGLGMCPRKRLPVGSETQPLI